MSEAPIHLPHDLQSEFSTFAAEHHWSLAETLHKALELMKSAYPTKKAPVDCRWEIPIIRDAGWRNLSTEQLKEVAADDETLRSLHRDLD